MFANSFKYIKFILRRERTASTIWIISTVAFATIITMAYPSILPDREAMINMATVMNTPAMRAMMGPVYGLESLTAAMVMTQECIIWLMVATAIMNIFFVNRHTRDEEETGKAEIIESLPVGRLSRSFAVIKVSFLINLVISALIALSLFFINIDGTTFIGCLAYGFSIGAVGVLFAGATYLFAQLFSTARAASGAALSIFLFFFMLRAFGDMTDSVVSLISPLGLGLHTFAFYENNFVPILIILLESIILFLIGFWICSVRDLGSGVFPARKGRANASKFLKSPLGLVWRLERNVVFCWILGLFALSASYGAVVPYLSTFVEGNDAIQQIIAASGGASIVDNYFAMVLIIVSLVSSVPIIMLMNRIVSEEKRGRLEQILAKPISRTKLISAYILIAFICTTIFPLICGIGLFAGAGVGNSELTTLVGAAYAYIPALWAVLGICVCLIGLLPRLTSLAWVVFVYSFFVVYFGRIIKLPEMVIKLSPFGNIPQLPVQEFEILPFIILTAFAIMLSIIGIYRYTQRDLGSVHL